MKGTRNTLDPRKTVTTKFHWWCIILGIQNKNKNISQFLKIEKPTIRKINKKIKFRFYLQRSRWISSSKNLNLQKIQDKSWRTSMEMESNPLTNFIYASTKEIHNQKLMDLFHRFRVWIMMVPTKVQIYSEPNWQNPKRPIKHNNQMNHGMAWRI